MKQRNIAGALTIILETDSAFTTISNLEMYLLLSK